MKLVIIESPYKGEIERNKKYLRSCIRDCLRRGESPYASHRMLTDALDDAVAEERELGIAAGLAWRRAFNIDDGVMRRVLPVFYVDLGWSGGMLDAAHKYAAEWVAYETRFLPPDDPFFAITKDA